MKFYKFRKDWAILIAYKNWIVDIFLSKPFYILIKVKEPYLEPILVVFAPL